MGNSTLEGKVTVLKALALSKIVRPALITDLLTSTMKELNKTQKEFNWKNKIQRTKHTTLDNK